MYLEINQGVTRKKNQNNCHFRNAKTENDEKIVRSMKRYGDNWERPAGKNQLNAPYSSPVCRERQRTIR